MEKSSSDEPQNANKSVKERGPATVRAQGRFRLLVMFIALTAVIMMISTMHIVGLFEEEEDGMCFGVCEIEGSLPGRANNDVSALQHGYSGWGCTG